MTEIYTKKFNTLPFEGAWKALIGEPELTGAWIVWGESGHGKTSFALQLAKYFATLGKRVAYDSLEEGASLSMKKAFMRTGMEEVKRKVILLDAEPIDQLIKRLKKRKSPDVVIIDSLQYTGMNYQDTLDLRSMFPKKLFVYISHADGKKPASRVAVSVRFDAFVKIRVEGYKAFAVSRYGGGKPYTIWEEGAADYHLD